MFRDDRDAMRYQLDVANKEASELKQDNEAMRQELLALRRGGTRPALSPYKAEMSELSPGERAAMAHHTVTPFPVWATAILHLCTFSLFSIIHFGLKHDQLPKAADDDPTGGKAIGFSFIPYFNFYWVFFNTLRLCDRLNLQLRLRGQEPDAPRGLMLACSIVGVIPYVNILIGLPILWTIGVCFLQSSVNKVAALKPGLVEPQPVLADPYSQPPVGLLPPA